MGEEQIRHEDCTILVVEDDGDISRLLCTYLQQEGYAVRQAFSGTEALLLLNEEVQLVLMDLMLPGLSGEALLGRIRTHSTVPVIVISGRAALEDQVSLLRLGADDYITKPFEKKDVLARVEAKLRRCRLYQSRPAAENTLLRYRGLEMDTLRYELRWEQNHIELTQTEFNVLKELMTHPGQVFSRDKLYKAIWNEDFIGDDNAITVHVSHLRQKLRQACGEDLIATVWGIGYKLH